MPAWRERSATRRAEIHARSITSLMPASFNVTLVIDELNAGGAQRDLVRLALGLKGKGHNVQVLRYWPKDFFADALASAHIPVAFVPSRTRWHLCLNMRRAIRRHRPDAVVSFLTGPNMLAELAGWPRRDFVLIAQELNYNVQGNTRRNRVAYALHRLADIVVCNSHAQAARLAELAPFLASRARVIVNGVDLNRFAPVSSFGSCPEGRPQAGQASDAIRVLVLARFQPQKNPFGLLDALTLVRRERPTLKLTVDWYGDPIVAPARRDAKWSAQSRHRLENFYQRLEREVARRSMGDWLRLHPTERKDVLSLYHAADVACLASLYEGTPNVLCEAMACGLPMLASRVGDMPRLVEEGTNGWIFEPQSPRDMADAILRMADASPATRRAMGMAGRKKAERLLSTELFVNRYDDLLRQVLADKRPSAEEPRA